MRPAPIGRHRATADHQCTPSTSGPACGCRSNRRGIHAGPASRRTRAGPGQRARTRRRPGTGCHGRVGRGRGERLPVFAAQRSCPSARATATAAFSFSGLGWSMVSSQPCHNQRMDLASRSSARIQRSQPLSADAYQCQPDNSPALPRIPWHGPVMRESAGEQPVFAARQADRLRCSESPAGVAQQAEQPSCKRQVSGSNPLTGSQFRGCMYPLRPPLRGTIRGTNVGPRRYPHVMPRVAKGYIEQLPSGSFRVTVYAGTDPLTRRAIRLKATAKTEQQAHIELGRLLKEASEGRTPESDATVATLLDEYAADRSVGRVHAADQRGLHPPHHQARPRAHGGAEGPRPHPRQAVRAAEALRRPVLHRQAVHRAPQRPGPGDQPPRPPPGLAAGRRDARRGHPVRRSSPRATSCHRSPS